jgi:hypothetical protein
MDVDEQETPLSTMTSEFANLGPNIPIKNSTPIFCQEEYNEHMQKGFPLDGSCESIPTESIPTESICIDDFKNLSEGEFIEKIIKMLEDDKINKTFNEKILKLKKQIDEIVNEIFVHRNNPDFSEYLKNHEKLYEMLNKQLESEFKQAQSYTQLFCKMIGLNLE